MKSYLKDHYSIYLLCFSIIILFDLVLYLFNASLEALEYATLLTFVLVGIYLIFDYFHYQQVKKQLVLLYERDYIGIDDLPKSNNDIENSYQTIINKLDSLQQALKTSQEEAYQEMLDYFTLWVHQIKTPISALELLIQSNQYSKNDLLMQLLRIEQYVDMTLHYLKLSHFSKDLKIQRCDLRLIIEEVIKKQTLFFIGKKIQLILDPIDLQVLTDEKWISFVLEQILSNALKYTKKGYIHIYVRDEMLYIEDSGIGIAEDDLPRIFEKGFTGSNGRIDKKASGLGLYLCNQIIGRLGHCIFVKSKVGKGTIVGIDFRINDIKNI